ncbi:MAG: hypothetical protein HYZ83_03120 [Candidatus Omnitrophica bacterium]|nr:hypothetical protein [Candidatus Omnitrophota bacterium]
MPNKNKVNAAIRYLYSPGRRVPLPASRRKTGMRSSVAKSFKASCMKIVREKLQAF